MDDNTAETREETITALTAALAELEGGEGLSRFVGGYGFMSRRFEFAWREPTLEIDFSLPYARVLADEGARDTRFWTDRASLSIPATAGPASSTASNRPCPKARETFP